MSWVSTLQARWTLLASRERRGVQLALAVLLIAALWWLALAPALRVLRGAELQHRALDAQIARMQQLQERAEDMRRRPRIQAADATRALQQSVQEQLGGQAQLRVNEDQATLTLRKLSAQALAQWLAQASLQAQVTISEAHLQRDPDASPATWSGSLVLRLPAP